MKSSGDKNPLARSDGVQSNNPEDILRHKRGEALRKVRELADAMEGEFQQEDKRGSVVFWGAIVAVAILAAFVVAYFALHKA